MEFCKSYDGKKVHVRVASGTYPVCGSGSYYGSWRLLKINHSEYPMSHDDICISCKKNKKVKDFLVTAQLKKAPDFVSSTVNVTVNIPSAPSFEDLERLSRSIDDVVSKYKDSGEQIILNVKGY